MALGFFAADLRAALVDAPIIQRDGPSRLVSGKLVSLENRLDDQRLLVSVQTISNLEAEETPRRVRLTWKGERIVARPGMEVSFRALLKPPPPPAAPHGYDYARRLYFERIGAVGYIISKPETISPTKHEARLAHHVERMRVALFTRIITAAPGEGGAVLAAIVTGKREAISESATVALRDSGLAHLLAISGLHMGLATGLIFIAVRFALASSRWVSDRISTKKWAAVIAIIAGICYLAISGGGWSPRRAFIMATIMLAAILVDRRALSLRNVAIAASLILLTTPEAIFHPGFQMSFAAGTALIAFYEHYRSGKKEGPPGGWLSRLKLYVGGVAATDVVASTATAPFALYHFHRTAIYSLPANLLATPLLGLWGMPTAILAIALMPIGLDGPMWRVSAAGFEVILFVAHKVSNWDGALALTPQWPVSALIVLVIGGLILCLGRSPLRYGGLLCLPLFAILISSIRAPTIYIDESGRNVGIRLESDDGAARYGVYAPRRDRFAQRVWMESAGLSPDAIFPLADEGNCDDVGCVFKLGKDQTVSIVEKPGALSEDCTRATIVIAFFPVSKHRRNQCAAKLFDQRGAWRQGARALYLTNDGTGPAIQLVSANDVRGKRPWNANASE